MKAFFPKTAVVALACLAACGCAQWQHEGGTGGGWYGRIASLVNDGEADPELTEKDAAQAEVQPEVGADEFADGADVEPALHVDPAAAVMPCDADCGAAVSCEVDCPAAACCEAPCPLLGACGRCRDCLAGRTCKLFSRPEPGPPPVRYRPLLPPRFLPVPTEHVVSPARPEAPDPWRGDVELGWRPQVTFPGHD